MELTVLLLIKKFGVFYQPESSLPCSKQLTHVPITPVLIQINPTHTHYHPVSLRSTSLVSYHCLPRLSKWSLRFTNQNHVYICLLSTTLHLPCQSHLLDLIIHIMCVESQLTELIIMQFSPVSCH
jgi:hypothetical protein